MRGPDADGFDDVATTLQPRVGARRRDSAAFVLVVVSGPDVNAALRVDAANATALVGQGPAASLRLSDRAVSRRHLSVELVGDRLRVRDLGSSNGTTVNGVSIVEAWCHGSETIAIGDTQLRVDVAESGPDAPITTAGHFGRYVGASIEMRRLYPLFERLAMSDVPVIIEGETGTGKELLAEALHEQGPRANGPFVVFDCTAVPSNLVEAELFGHERGAFTTALTQRKGVFEQAHGGTLLIDEIGDLDLALQPKLLRALDRSEIKRIGGDKTIRVDVRLLAATRRDLDAEVMAGRFRDDLYHRIAVGRIELPPLRHRSADIAILAHRFWEMTGGPSSGPPTELLAKWTAESWPGNVRELRNAVSRYLAVGAAWAHAGRKTLAEPAGAATEADQAAPSASADASADVVAQTIAMRLPLPEARRRVVEDLERRYVEQVLEEHGGDIGRAAAASGIARRYFQLIRARTRK